MFDDQTNPEPGLKKSDVFISTSIIDKKCAMQIKTLTNNIIKIFYKALWISDIKFDLRKPEKSWSRLCQQWKYKLTMKGLLLWSIFGLSRPILWVSSLDPKSQWRDEDDTSLSRTNTKLFKNGGSIILRRPGFCSSGRWPGRRRGWEGSWRRRRARRPTGSARCRGCRRSSAARTPESSKQVSVRVVVTLVVQRFAGLPKES